MVDRTDDRQHLFRAAHQRIIHKSHREIQIIGYECGMKVVLTHDHRRHIGGRRIAGGNDLDIVVTEIAHDQTLDMIVGI